MSNSNRCIGQCPDCQSPHVCECRKYRKELALLLENTGLLLHTKTFLDRDHIASLKKKPVEDCSLEELRSYVGILSLGLHTSHAFNLRLLLVAEPTDLPLGHLIVSIEKLYTALMKFNDSAMETNLQLLRSILDRPPATVRPVPDSIELPIRPLFTEL